MSSKIDFSKMGAIDYYPPPEPPKKKTSLDFIKNVFAGSVSGVAAVGFIQPMIYFKNIQQAAANSTTQTKGFEKNPRIWYRGAGGFAASFAPTIALQTAANGVFANSMDSFSASLTAGMISAVVVCPAEGIMNQQQKTGTDFAKTAKYIYTSYGVQGFFRAFTATAIREGYFTAAYLGATPILKEEMICLGFPEWAAQIAAGTISGTLGAVVSHPFDTFKTQKQRDFSLKTSMIKEVFQQKTFAGLPWRIAMIVTAAIVMPPVQNFVNKMIDSKIQKL